MRSLAQAASLLLERIKACTSGDLSYEDQSVVVVAAFWCAGCGSRENGGPCIATQLQRAPDA